MQLLIKQLTEKQKKAHKDSQKQQVIKMAESSFRPPQNLDLGYTKDRLSEVFKDWRRKLEIDLEASGAADKSKNTQVAIILTQRRPSLGTR